MAEDSSDYTITPEEFSYHFAYYHRITPHRELLGGERAREFFLQSKLPPQSLSHIWKLADVDRDGQLNAAEFCVAMHLVQRALKGIPPPPALPAPLMACIQVAVNPRLPMADDKHLQKCTNAFGAFHENIGKGVLGGDAARYLFMKSNLSKGQLFHIWKLSDQDEDGHLTFHEFTIAMHLIFVAKLGYTLPIDLDPTTILPASFNTTMREVQAVAEKLPETESVRVTLRPFSPPTESTDAFHSAAPEIFRDGRFEDFVGDPFQTMDPFTGDAPQSLMDTDSAFVPQPPSKPKPDSPPLAWESSPLKQESPPSTKESLPPPKPKRQSPYLAQESPPLVESKQDSPLPSQVRTVTPPQVQTKSETPPLSQPPPPRPKSETPPISQSPKPPTPSQASPTIVSNRIEVMVVERTEPSLLQAQAIDVAGSHEETPSDEVFLNESDEDRELSKEQEHIDLEELSQASRKFLQESEGKLAEQQRRNLPGGNVYRSFGMAEYRSASLKGLSATIEEMQGRPEQPDEPVRPAKQERAEDDNDEVDLGEPVKSGDMIAHLDGLEAEILTALDDANVALDHVSNGEEEAIDMATAREVADIQTRDGDLISSQKEVGGVSEPNKGLISSLQGVGGTVTTKDPSLSRPPPAAPKPSKAIPEARQRETELVKQEVPLRRVQNRTSYESYATKRKSYIEEVVMEDLDQYLQAELDNINDMFQEFQTQDKQSEQRIRSESQDLQAMESKAKEDHRLELQQLKVLEEKKLRESKNLELEWEEEMARLEMERLKQMEKEQIVDDLTIESDTALQNLEQQWQSLLGQGEQLVKETQREKELREQREKEERERRERERKEKRNNQEEMTVEQWIGWMEEKKKAGMTPEQLAEYERRKRVWQEREKVREEKRKREEEERLRKSRERMEQEYQQYRSRERDIKDSRLSEAEIRQLQREKNRQEEEERKLRVEKHRQNAEIARQKEFEELKPKARSSLAARWEEQVKSRNQGPKAKDYRSTVLTGEVLSREEERMRRRINSSGVTQNGVNGTDDKRKSLQ